MAELNYDQAAFTQGELDPRTQARADWERYYKSAKAIRNCLVIPQGGVQRRFGLTYVAAVAGNPANPLFCELSTLLFDNDATYLLVWTALELRIYLENILVTAVPVVTQYNQEDIPNLRFAQIDDRAIVVNPFFQPQQLTRSADPNNAITGFSGANNTLTITNALAVGIVLPALFTSTVTPPTTNPQIYAGRTYFIKAITANTIQIYSTSKDAAAGTNFYTITNAGVGVVNLVTQNTWAIANFNFRYMPHFDFGGVNYFGAAVTFTPSAVSGNITITCAGATPFTAAHIGGLYTGNGGIVRIIAPFISNTQVNGYTISAFPNTNAIRGDLSLVAEPAWSNTRGWPRTVSFFQNRLVFGGSTSIPNGVWLSVSNAADDFDDSETLADNAISWYPASGSINLIRALTSGRSLIVHTNTGNYSTPVSTETVWTPSNFTLTEQNKYGVSDIQPVFIDNQILFTDISGNSVINMLWEFTQSSYVTNNRSIAASTLINHPVDMAALAVPDFTDGYYAFFTNIDGSLAIHQTLLEEDVKAWSLGQSYTAITNQNTFTQVLSNFVRVVVGKSRCWFTLVRYVPNNTVAITGFSGVNNTLTAVGHGMTVETPYQVVFTTTGNLPTTLPPLNTTNSFWVRPIDANTFQIYDSQTNALNSLNQFTVSDAGTNTSVIILQTQLQVEELDFSVFTDASKKYTFAAATNTLTGLAYLNGQTVQVVGDGFVLQNQQVAGGQVVIERNVRNATIGVQMNSILTPLPVTLPQAFGLLYKPKHIRKLMLQVYNTLGITVQGITVPELQIQNIVFGQVPVPQTGVFEVPLMEGWNGFEFDINIQQTLPLPMTILALSYRIEV